MSLRKVCNLMMFFSLCSVSSLSFPYVDYGPIKSGDSLWKIAASHRVAHVSTQKMVHAIQALNPSLKKLKTGATLKLPSTIEEVKAALEASPPKVASLNSQKIDSTPKIEEKSSSSNQPVAKENSGVTPSVSQKVDPTPLAAPIAQSTTQLTSPVVLARQTEMNSKDSTSSSVSSVSVDRGASFWAWLWFFGLVAVLGFGWKNRYKLFAHLRGGKDIAARRLGLNRVDNEQAFDTNPLWTKGKPSYAGGALREGDSMAEAMIQMAEGEYSEAKKTLEEAIERDPKNIDYRMKLLEVSVALDDRELFKQESDYLLEYLMDQADPRWGKIKSMYLRKWAYDAA